MGYFFIGLLVGSFISFCLYACIIASKNNKKGEI